MSKRHRVTISVNLDEAYTLNGLLQSAADSVDDDFGAELYKRLADQMLDAAFRIEREQRISEHIANLRKTP